MTTAPAELILTQGEPSYSPISGRAYVWTYYNPNTLHDSSPAPFVGPTKITDLSNSATVWANVKAKSGREGMTNDRVTATFVVVFTIRNRADLLPQDRIVWGGVNYNIRAFLSEGARPQYLAIEAERGVAS